MVSNRPSVLIKLVLLFALTCATFSGDDYTAAQRFAAEYNSWAVMRSQAQRGGTDAREIRQWQAVRVAWKALDHEIRY